MHSTLNPNRSDRHDAFVDAPDVVPAAHADLAFFQDPHDAMDRPSNPQAYMESDVPPVPPVDTTFRATDVNNLKVLRGRSRGARAMRGVIGFLLAVCVGVAGALWQSHGDVATAMIAKWVPQLAPSSSPPPESPALAEQPSPSVVQASTETAAPSQPAAVAQTTPESVAPAAAASSSDAAQLQSMAQDLAHARQEIEQLKASVAQLKASQDQMSRDVAKVSDVRTSDQALRPRVSPPLPRPAAAPPPRPVAAPVRKPAPLLRPSQASVAPVYPQAAAPPPMPRQVEPRPQPLAPAPPQVEPQVSSVLRPPMPVP